MRKRLEVKSECLEHLSHFKDWQIGFIKDTFNVRIHLRRGRITLHGEDKQVDLCEKAIQTLLEGFDSGKNCNRVIQTTYNFLLHIKVSCKITRYTIPINV